ncbi:hypothetical protein FH972_010489 [Carpinus fangiana]|uniref:KIB1-4 beta-propeller domain-containing protein n=1 Tax=Carpinus fangiana TaxID=176857 RepID=A0A660KUI6_9ROSI|nr:hypothetical protein FH972_010489 [Carpinus fangiana]
MPWHAIALENYYGERRHKLSLQQPPLPLLFLTHTVPSEEGEITIGIHSISQNKTFELNSFIPSGNHDKCLGSSHGWLITVDYNYVITLSNPFCSNGIICLPPILHINLLHIRKVILSDDPIVASDDYTVMVIYADGLCPNELGFIRPGDKGWTYIKNDSVMDVIFSKGLFYALYAFGSVKTLDISEHYPKLNKVSPTCYSSASFRNKSYIVESAGGDILKFVRLSGIVYDEYFQPFGVTKGFEVSKLQVSNGEKKWVATTDPNVLGDGALFLGDNSSTYVPASDVLGCHPNSIFFFDCCVLDYALLAGVCPRTSYGMGIFYLGDGSFQWHYVPKILSSPKLMLLPIWIKPTFQGK